MRITVKIALICAFIWMLAKFVYHWFMPNTDALQPTILLNMLLLLLAISLGLYYHKKKEGFTSGNAMSDIKAAMTAGVPYALFVSLFAYFYYAKINPEFNQHQIVEAKTLILKELNDPAGLARAKSNAAFELLTKEQIYQQLVKGPKTIYSATSTFVLMLLGLVLLSTVYSILVTIIYRKVMFRKL